jgi:hypothetical protein
MRTRERSKIEDPTSNQEGKGEKRIREPTRALSKAMVVVVVVVVVVVLLPHCTAF